MRSNRWRYGLALALLLSTLTAVGCTGAEPLAPQTQRLTLSLIQTNPDPRFETAGLEESNRQLYRLLHAHQERVRMFDNDEVIHALEPRVEYRHLTVVGIFEHSGTDRVDRSGTGDHPQLEWKAQNVRQHRGI